MPFRRSVGMVRAPLRPKRRYQWHSFVQSNPGASVGVGTTNALFILPEAAIDEMGTPTVIRIRGSVFFQLLDTVGAQSTETWWGIIAAQALAVSGTLQDPNATADLDWLTWDAVALNNGGTGVSSQNLTSERACVERIIDVRAKRIMREGYVLALNTRVAGSAGGVVQMTVNLRILCMVGH